MRFNPHAFKRAETTIGPGTATAAAMRADDDQPTTISPQLAAFIAAYGRLGANQVTIPEGSLAVTLSLKFNDSAAQVDHFDYHAPLGCPAFLVLLAKKQAQTEHLARKALSACAELHALDWTWKSEKYGGGHGNYLISSPTELPAAIREVLTVRTTFGGQPVTRAFWEIQFASPWRGSALQLWPHRHYGDHPPETDFSNGRHPDPDPIHPSIYSSNNPIVAAWCLNDARRGVEIHFTRRPDDATLAPLRADRAWNYTGRTKCWYARQTDATVAWAKAFCEHFNNPPSPAGAGEGGRRPDEGQRANLLAGVGDAPGRGSAARRADEGRVEKLAGLNGVPSPVVSSSVISSPIVPRLPAETSERRLERKIIRFTDTGHEGIGSSRGIVRDFNPAVGTWTPVITIPTLPAEGEVLAITDLMRPKVPSSDHC